jgi:hypothetical protein
MHGAELVHEEVVRREAVQGNLKLQRSVKLRLAPDWPRPLVLTWNEGIVGKTIGQKTRRVIKPGQATLLDIGRAQAYFGLFTMPRDIEDVLDETRRQAMLEAFLREKARAILTWGDFPKPQNHIRSGEEALGPARMPDVFLTVIEADGDEWPEFRLRGLYDLGDYWDAELKPRALAAAGPSEVEVLRLANDEKDKQIHSLAESVAELKGLVHGFLAAKPQGKNGS